MTLDEAIAALAADGVTVAVEQVVRLRYAAHQGGALAQAELAAGDEAGAVDWLRKAARLYHAQSAFAQAHGLDAPVIGPPQ